MRIDEGNFKDDTSMHTKLTEFEDREVCTLVDEKTLTLSSGKPTFLKTSTSLALEESAVVKSIANAAFLRGSR